MPGFAQQSMSNQMGGGLGLNVGLGLTSGTYSRSSQMRQMGGMNSLILSKRSVNRNASCFGRGGGGGGRGPPPPPPS